MFGFLSHASPTRTYRQIYARCCSVQHRALGTRTLPFVSYEAVFLYALAVDLGIASHPHATDPTCCRGRRLIYHWKPRDLKLAEFCAHFAMLLLSVKLDDDVRDNQSLMARGGRMLMRRPTRLMQAYFRSLDPHFDARLGGLLDQHARLENAQTSHPLESYVLPTSEAFAYVIGLAPVDSESSKWLVEVGKQIGAALIAFDCAADWHQDKQNGCFNPLGTTADVDAAYEFSIRQLAAAGWTVSDAAKDDVSLSVLRSRIRSIAKRRRLPQLIQRPNRPKRFFDGRLVRYGDCDCGGCDCACGDGGCTDSCTGDTSGCSSFSCSEFVCQCCGESYLDEKRGKKTDQSQKKNHPTSQQDSLLGKLGHTSTLLAPYGSVVIDGVEHPAKCEHAAIEKNQAIEVLDRQPSGLVVRAKESDR